MSETVYEDGTNRSHEELYQEEVAEEPGYYYIYTRNDSPTASEAFSRDKPWTGFHDFSVEVVESPQNQMTASAHPGP